jgi:hypothetical protein
VQPKPCLYELEVSDSVSGFPVFVDAILDLEDTHLKDRRKGGEKVGLIE